MERKFNEGDKVRFVKDNFEEKAFLVGQIGEIVQFNEDPYGSGQDWLVRFDDAEDPTNGSDDGWWCTDEEIEKVSPDGE